MSARRIDNTPEDQAGKAAAAKLVRAVGGMEAAEGYCRSNMRRLSEYGRPDNDCFMPMDVIADLEAVSHGTVGHPIVTRYLAARAGYVLVARPSLDLVAIGNLHVACAAHAKEHGEATARVVGLLGGEAITAAQIDEAVIEVDQGIEEAVRLRALLITLKDHA